MNGFGFFAKTIGGLLTAMPMIEGSEFRDREMSQASIDVGPTGLSLLGRGNEELRERFSSIFERTNSLIALRDDVVDAVRQIDAILKTSEKVSSELAETRGKFARLDAEHEHMLGQFRAAREECESLRRETAVRGADIARYTELVGAREKRIDQLEAEVGEALERARVADQENDAANADLIETREQLLSARNFIAANDKEIAKLQDDLEARNAQLSRSEFLLQGLRKAVEEGHEQTKVLRDEIAAHEARVAVLSGELSGSRVEVDAGRKRIQSMESAISNMKMDFEIAASLRQQQADAQAAQIEELKSKLAATEARAASAEQMLAEARNEAHARSAEARAAERRIQELETKLFPLDARAKSLSQENAELSRALNEFSVSRVRLANRSKALVRAMKDQRAKTANATQTVQLLEDRIASERATFDGVAEDLRGQIRDLTDRLEQEQAAHQMDLAALEVARGRMQQSGNQLSLHELLARAENAGEIAGARDFGAGSGFTLGESQESRSTADPRDPFAAAPSRPRYVTRTLGVKREINTVVSEVKVRS